MEHLLSIDSPARNQLEDYSDTPSSVKYISHFLLWLQSTYIRYKEVRGLLKIAVCLIQGDRIETSTGIGEY